MKTEQLANVLKGFPNYEVLLSSDEEGNEFGTIERKGSCFSIGKAKDGKKTIDVLILYPYKTVDPDHFNSSFLEAKKGEK